MTEVLPAAARVADGALLRQTLTMQACTAWA
jgi:hypothetical protein